MSVTVTDLFAGAGGTATGAEQAGAEDCQFRMLEPCEITRGMAFPEGYLMLGTRREQVKLAGNAVTPPVARDLVSVAIAALGGAA